VESPEDSPVETVSPRQGNEDGTSRLPARVRLLILAVGLAGAASLAWRAPEITHWSRENIWGFMALAGAVTVAELFPLALRRRTEILYLSLTDALWTAGLVLILAGSSNSARPGILTAAVGVGTVLGQALRRRAVVKIAFNVGQYLLAVTVAEVIFAALHPHSPSDPTVWLYATLAMAACFALNASATALVISWVEGESFPSVLLPPLTPNVMHWVGNLCLGVLISVTWTQAPSALPLMIVPLAVSYSAYRAWLRGIGERDVMRNLYEAGQSLLGPLDAAGFDRFLSLVRGLLIAQAAELVIVDGERVTIHSESGTLELTATPQASEGHSPSAYVRVHQGIGPQVAVIGGPDDPEGVLAIYRSKPLTASDRSLLEALASQVGARLLNHRLYREVAEQRTRLADIIANTTDGIFTATLEGLILSWNPAMERITGLSAVDALGRRWHDVIESQTMSSTSLEGAPTSEDILLIRTDGSEQWIRTARNPIGDPQGELAGEVVVARDVTAELEAERMKADFVATVSHELRTPLTPLKGLVATLLAGIGEDSVEVRREYYQIMKRQAGRLERLIIDLLQVSAIDAGGLSVETGSVDLSALVCERVEEVRAEHPDRRIDLRAADGRLVVAADPFRVGQVLANLLSNAAKHSPFGTPLEVRLIGTGREAVVSVRDEGEGIHPADQHRVFERFYRAAETQARQTGGAGLGLYIAQRLVVAMGGRIWLVSAPGNGSTFSFSLPLVPVPAVPETAVTMR
jgi:PAS domain S-box-containing protein